MMLKSMNSDYNEYLLLFLNVFQVLGFTLYELTFITVYIQEYYVFLKSKRLGKQRIKL